MNPVIGDLHVHTVASGHAYSTVLENATVALEKGLTVLGVADHGPSMPGGPPAIYFEARGHFPRQIEEVRVFFGAEVDIIDENGNLDLPPHVLKKLDYAIVSFHPQVYSGGSREENTRILLQALSNPLVDIVAHAGNPRYPLDYRVVVREAVAQGKIFEINNSSFAVSRKGSSDNCRAIAQEILHCGGELVVSSDAHFCHEIGEYKHALDLLSSIHFPCERILNVHENRLLQFLEYRKERKRSLSPSPVF